MRAIDADALYERLKADEELARDRVIDTPSSFPNGAVNPSAIRYSAQLSERTRFKEIVFDAPTIEERKKGKWIDRGWSGDGRGNSWHEWECSECKHITKGAKWDFCPNCGADMRKDGEADEGD